MPSDTQQSPADQLADLLDGRITADDVSPEVAELADLAASVRTHITLVPPTEAFREALREQVAQAATGPAGAGTTASGVGTTTTGAATTTTVATGSGAFSSLVAGVAATAILAAGTATAADRAGPGDLLAGLDRGLEQAQLALAGDEADVGLLVGFATERVLEALDVVDPAIVGDLLAEAQDLVDEGLRLAVSQGRAVEDLVAPYVSALRTLASRTDDPTLLAQIEQRLADIGADGLEGTQPGAPAPSGDGAQAPDDAEDTSSAGGDDATADDAGDDPVQDVTDDVTDTVDDVTDDVTDTVDDVTDDVSDTVDDVTDTVDDVTDTVDDVTDTVDDTVDGLLDE